MLNYVTVLAVRSPVEHCRNHWTPRRPLSYRLVQRTAFVNPGGWFKLQTPPFADGALLGQPATGAPASQRHSVPFRDYHACPLQFAEGRCTPAGGRPETER